MDFLKDQLPESQLILSDENGVQMAFHFLDLIVYEEQEYMALLPAEGPYRDEVVFLRRERGDEPDDESYADVDDPDTLQAVYGIFRDRFRDKFLFDD